MNFCIFLKTGEAPPTRKLCLMEYKPEMYQVPNTAIHTEVTTLCNITFAEHLGILLMLRSYSCVLNVYFTIIQNI
jgi:hypothetical protein